MGTTTNYGWPYPASTDTPDGATQIRSLADAIDLTVFNLGKDAVLCTNSGGQTLTDDTAVALTFDTNTYISTASLHSTSSNTSRIVATGTGSQLWAVFASAQFASGIGNGERRLYFRVNGAATQYWDVNDEATSISIPWKMSTAGLVPVTGGQYIEVWAYQNQTSGTTGALVSGSARFGAMRVR